MKLTVEVFDHPARYSAVQVGEIRNVPSEDQAHDLVAVIERVDSYYAHVVMHDENGQEMRVVEGEKQTWPAEAERGQ